MTATIESTTMGSVSQAKARLRAPRWLSFTIGKIAKLVLVIVGVTFPVSVMLDFLPGNPAQVILGPDATAEQVAVLEERLGLDESVFVRYGEWLWSALHGDFGTSIRTSQPVWDAVVDRLPVSIELMILVQVMAISMALVAALYVTYRPDGLVDKILTWVAFAGISIPHFVISLVLIYFVALKLDWLPPSGWEPLSAGLGTNLSYLILPATALAIDLAAVYLRLLRSDLRTSLSEEYVLAAQAKGMSSANILLRQMLRPSSFSLVTLAGINIARMIGSAVVIETMFALPGMGRLLVDSITARDFVTIQALVAVIAVVYVLVNTVVDGLYLLLDPRVRDR